MKVIIIKHIDFEGPGYIYDYLIEMGCEVKIKLISNDFRFPEQEEFDFLILLRSGDQRFDRIFCI